MVPCDLGAVKVMAVTVGRWVGGSVVFVGVRYVARISLTRTSPLFSYLADLRKPPNLGRSSICFSSRSDRHAWDSGGGGGDGGGGVQW